MMKLGVAGRRRVCCGSVVCGKGWLVWFFSDDQSEADDQDRRTSRPKSPHQEGEGKLNLQY